MLVSRNFHFKFFLQLLNIFQPKDRNRMTHFGIFKLFNICRNFAICLYEEYSDVIAFRMLAPISALRVVDYMYIPTKCECVKIKLAQAFFIKHISESAVSVFCH